MKKIKYNNKEYEYDGRLIREEDQIYDVEFVNDKYTMFIDTNSNIRLVDKNGKIIIDFDEHVVICDPSYGSYVVCLTLDNEFRIIDENEEELFYQEDVYNYHRNKEIVTIDVACDDEIDRTMVLGIDGEVLVSLEEDFVKYKVAEDGTTFCQVLGKPAAIFKEGDFFEHGYEELLDVDFFKQFMLVKGITRKATTSTAVYCNGEEIACFGGHIYATVSDLGILVLEVVYNGHHDLYVYDSEGNRIEKILDLDKHGKNGRVSEVTFNDTGTLISNKKGYCRYIMPDGENLVDYSDKRANVVYVDENFYFSSKLFTPQKMFRALKNEEDYDLHVTDTKGIIPDMYLKNAYFMGMQYGFIYIYKADVYREGGLNLFGIDLIEKDVTSKYHSVVVLNDKGKLITHRREEITYKEGVMTGLQDMTTTIVNQTPSAIGFKDGSKIIYFDHDANQYDKEPLIGPNKDIYLVNDGYIDTYKLSTLPSSVIEAFKKGDAEIIEEVPKKLVNKPVL